MTNKQDQVLFADIELTVHQPGSIFGSKIILPGQFIALADLPDYQREAAIAGKIIGGRVLDANEARIITNQAARQRGELVEETTDFGEEETPQDDE